MKGDYQATSYDAWSVLGPVLSALRSAAVTWVRPRTVAFISGSPLLRTTSSRYAPILDLFTHIATDMIILHHVFILNSHCYSALSA